MKPSELAICVECNDVHESYHTACPKCTCTSAIPLSRITQGRREGDHLETTLETWERVNGPVRRLSPDWPYTLGPKKAWKETP